MSKEALSGQDAAFLAFEAPGRPMHVGVLALLAVPPGEDAEELAGRIRDALVERLPAIPRFRSCLGSGRGGPHWTPAPGSWEAGRQVHVLPSACRPSPRGERSGWMDRVGSLFARPLDPKRPLWEAWILPGIEEGRRVALLVKAHHAMLDGTAGLSVLARLLEPDPASAPASPLADASRHPRGDAISGSDAAGTRSPARSGLRGLLDLVRRLLSPTVATSLNGPMSPAREIATLELDEEVLRAAARDAGGSTYDALLTLVADGVGRWLEARGERLDGRGLRAFCPVDLRGGADASDLGNHLGAWLVDLPAGRQPWRDRLRSVVRATGATRRLGHAGGVGLLGRLAGFLPALFPRLGMRLAGWLRAFNLVVTEVRGPRQPLRFAGARLASLTVLAPVFPNQRCSVAAFRYQGRIHLGLTGAWPQRGECRRLADAIAAAYDGLRGRPEVPAPAPGGRPAAVAAHPAAA